MNRILLKTGFGVFALAGMVWMATASVPANLKQLHGHVPAAVANLTPLGRLNGTNQLHLAIGLPLRNQSAMALLLQQINDPSSSNYRHYLTPQQFKDQFAPTAQEYQAAMDFAKAGGLTVTQTHDNRLLVEVEGRAADVEKAFNITFHTYHHPNENRDFFAPATEPSVPAALSVLDVSGLNNYARPHPKLHLKPANMVAPQLGSGPSGTYMGNDFRAAYIPGTTLTGSGQQIALVQFDGYLASDIALYAQKAGLPPVNLTNILLNGFSGNPTGTGGEVEVSLDIEMVISMAPNLDRVLVYEGDPFNFIPNVVLNRIAVDNAARQVSCSWGWTGGPNATSDQIFLQMALQGQSFYNASGDSDAFLPGQADDPNGFGYPSCSPYIIQVGGTTLTTTGPGGAYVSEKVWNWGGGSGSSGGISDHYSTPTWQQGFGTATNHGSVTGRNIPDVALTADNVYVIADNGIDYPGVGGTSCAAPLWAGFTALVNQQAALNSLPSVGFINPAIYSLAKSASYTSAFNDITNGNNFWSLSPTNFPAVKGYDLCTGLGTPNGVNFINTLLGGASSGNPIISAPLPPWGSTLSVMNGSNPNGFWYLFIQDDKPKDVGMITNGWSVALTTANPVGYAADNQLYVSATNQANATNLTVTPGANFSFTLAVTNYGPSSATNVFVTDTLPSTNLTLLSAIPSAGSVTPLGATLEWTVGNLPINTGATLTLTFHAGSPDTGTNSAVVNATTPDPNSDDDAVSTLITVSSPVPPVLVPSYSLTGGNFQLSVTNAPGQSVIIESSTNLVNWIPIFTNTEPFIFTNFNTTNFPQQFYRAITGQ